MMQAHPNANATSIFTSSGKAAREFAKHATASMVGVNIGVAAPMAYFPFGGAKDSFFGDLKAHGRDGIRVLHRQEGHDHAVVLDADYEALRQIPTPSLQSSSVFVTPDRDRDRCAH